MISDIDSLKRKLLVKYGHFGSITANVTFKSDETVKTACTDGEVIYYNPSFLNKLTTNEKIFLLAHEVCHIAFNHILRSEGKEPKLWNIATDAVINAYLCKDNLPLIKGVINIPEARNYDAEELYEKLLKEKNENPNGSGNGNSQGDNSTSESSSNDDEVGHDSHSMWKDAVKKNKENNENNNENKENKEENNVIKQKQKELEKEGEKEAFKKNEEEKKELLKNVENDLNGKKAGDQSNSNTLEICNIGSSKQLIDWRKLLRECINYDIDWSYKNATIENGVVTPHLEDIAISEAEILLDTSGSIDTELLKCFLRECKYILKNSKVKVGCFDRSFYGFNIIRNQKDIDNMIFIGGGGTDFNAAINAFSRRVDNRILFTDGYAPMPEEKLKVIWVVFGNNLINPKGGKVIYVNRDDLENKDKVKIKVK